MHQLSDVFKYFPKRFGRVSNLDESVYGRSTNEEHKIAKQSASQLAEMHEPSRDPGAADADYVP